MPRLRVSYAPDRTITFLHWDPRPENGIAHSGLPPGWKANSRGAPSLWEAGLRRAVARSVGGARQPIVLGIVVVLLAFGAACGSGGGSGTGAVATTVAQTPNDGGGTATTRSAAPRWETVVTLSGSGPTRPQPFSILASAIQWRARYSCSEGNLRLTTDPPPRRPGPMVETSCPKDGEGFSIVTGQVTLAVETTGPWKVIVDQQLDTPLDEPPLPAMATALGRGSFYDVEKQTKGSARLYRLPDGRHALRMEDFEVSQNTDLFVWLAAAVAPKTSKEAVSAEYWELRNLKSTVGNQNYDIPENVPLERVNSVVIWCQPVAIAYGAAALDR
jgi:hypothetical protein